MSSRRPPAGPERTTTGTGYSSRELDELIAEITVDAYGEDEALTGFEVAFDDLASFPCRERSSGRRSCCRLRESTVDASLSPAVRAVVAARTWRYSMWIAPGTPTLVGFSPRTGDGSDAADDTRRIARRTRGSTSCKSSGSRPGTSLRGQA